MAVCRICKLYDCLQDLQAVWLSAGSAVDTIVARKLYDCLQDLQAVWLSAGSAVDTIVACKLYGCRICSGHHSGTQAVWLSAGSASCIAVCRICQLCGCLQDLQTLCALLLHLTDKKKLTKFKSIRVAFCIVN